MRSATRHARTIVLGIVMGLSAIGCGEVDEAGTGDEAPRPADEDPGNGGDTGDVQDEPDSTGEEIGGIVAGDDESQCAWLENGVGDRMELTLPDGWATQFSPVQIVDGEGEVVAEEGDELWWGPIQDTDDREVECGIDDAIDTRHLPDHFDVDGS